MVLPFAPKYPKLLCRKLGKEHLYFTLPPAHPLASRKSLRREGPPPDRVVVLIDDPRVQITYYACCEKKLAKRLKLGL